jgi:hypothetical protein
MELLDKRILKLLYKPMSLLISAFGGVLAAAPFKKVWTAVSGEDEAPDATSEHGTKEVLLAAVIQGAIFAGMKAAVDRAGARGFKKLTGTDPNE